MCINRASQEALNRLRKLALYLAIAAVLTAGGTARAIVPVTAAADIVATPVAPPTGAPRGVGNGVPQQINHQGVVEVNGGRFNGTGSFRFALLDPGTGSYYWTNDGSAPAPPTAPTNATPLAVLNGVYNLRLGDISLPNMIALPGNLFTNDAVSLRIWFDDGTNGVQQLVPDQPISAAPYAFRAATADLALAASPGAGAIPGEIRIWAGPEATIPSGWLLCDGSEELIADYPNLHNAIGTSWGGNGITTFRRPDLRGRFLRGVHGTQPGDGDPNAATRVASNLGGNSGNLVGSMQLDATARPNTNFTTNSDSHSHTVPAYTGGPGGPQIVNGALGSTGANVSTTSDSHSHSITGGGDAETRPVNVYVHYIIKS